MKPGPLFLMVLLPLLGVWLILNRPSGADDVALRPGATTQHVRIAQSRGLLEVVQESDGSNSYRILMGGEASPVLNEVAARNLFGSQLTEQLSAGGQSTLFELLNITGWASLVWVAVGLGGQAIFMSRFLIQWIVSERKRESVIPPIFWWISLVGAVCLFAYFVWRRDLVGVLGQSTGVVIYARNIRLIQKQCRRLARQPQPPASTSPAVGESPAEHP